MDEVQSVFTKDCQAFLLLEGHGNHVPWTVARLQIQFTKEPKGRKIDDPYFSLSHERKIDLLAGGVQGNVMDFVPQCDPIRRSVRTPVQPVQNMYTACQEKISVLRRSADPDGVESRRLPILLARIKIRDDLELP